MGRGGKNNDEWYRVEKSGAYNGIKETIGLKFQKEVHGKRENPRSRNARPILVKSD